MRKIIIIGCPGAGKSTFARKLNQKLSYPLYYLDMKERIGKKREIFVFRSREEADRFCDRMWKNTF